MVKTPIMTTSGAVLIKAGKNVSNDVSGATVVQFINEAESLVNNLSRVNYSNTYTSLDADLRSTLDEVVSSLAAISSIIYDMSGYTSRYEAETMLDVLRDAALRGLSLLRDKQHTDFLDGT